MATKKNNLPFKVGQLVESKWFIPGYRSSWFRCKVKEISWKRGEIVLEYIDFPGEKKNWTKLYQKPPNTKSRTKDVRKELMVRPCYPHIYRENEIQDSSQISEASVILGNGWMVGDFVDWWADEVYWCGEVIQLLDGDKAKIKLPDKPIGEGDIYDVECKDLRPSLVWSLDHGWTLPIIQVGGNSRCCARLIQPTAQGELATAERPNDARISKSKINDITSSHVSAYSLQPRERPGNCSANPMQNQESSECKSTKASNRKNNIHLGFEDYASGKSSFLDSGPRSPFRDANNMVKAVSKDNKDKMVKADDKDLVRGSCKRMKTGEEVDSSFENIDTLEAYYLQLEEQASKLRWLNTIIKHGNPQPSWKFVENRVKGAQK